MILWPILALMTLMAVAAVWWPLARRKKSVGSGSDVAVYRDQLDEIDRDEAAGLVGGVEAEAALTRNDAYGFFQSLGDLVETGPTRTNVNDFRAILVRSPQSD